MPAEMMNNIVLPKEEKERLNKIMLDSLKEQEMQQVAQLILQSRGIMGPQQYNLGNGRGLYPAPNTIG